MEQRHLAKSVSEHATLHISKDEGIDRGVSLDMFLDSKKDGYPLSRQKKKGHCRWWQFPHTWVVYSNWIGSHVIVWRDNWSAGWWETFKPTNEGSPGRTLQTTELAGISAGPELVEPAGHTPHILSGNNRTTYSLAANREGVYRTVGAFFFYFVLFTAFCAWWFVLSLKQRVHSIVSPLRLLISLDLLLGNLERTDGRTDGRSFFYYIYLFSLFVRTLLSLSLHRIKVHNNK